jgi:hypothetical protein
MGGGDSATELEVKREAEGTKLWEGVEDILSRLAIKDGIPNNEVNRMRRALMWQAIIIWRSFANLRRITFLYYSEYYQSEEIAVLTATWMQRKLDSARENVAGAMKKVSGDGGTPGWRAMGRKDSCGWRCECLWAIRPNTTA